MTDSDNLSEREKEFIELFTRNFDSEGKKRGMGWIMALLMYMATSPEKALTQQEIADLLDLSVSQVSRLLKILVESKRCTFTEGRTEKNRREKKYFIKTNFKEIIVDRMSHGINEYSSLKNDITALKAEIMKEHGNNNSDLQLHLERMEKMSEDVILFFTKAMALAREMFSDTW